MPHSLDTSLHRAAVHGVFRRCQLAAAIGMLAVSSVAMSADVDDWWFYVKNDRLHQIDPLLAQGVDPNRVSPDGQPTLVEAVRAKAWKTFDALAANPKVNLEAANAQGETALMLLSVLGETERVATLLARGAQVNRLGWTPLHYAASRARMPVADLLIARGAIINAPAPDGTTPLMMAALSKNTAMVRRLLDAGADPTTRNLSGLSAADWARSADAEKLAVMLDQAGARTAQQRGGAAARPGQPAAGAPARAMQTERAPATAQPAPPQAADPGRSMDPGAVEHGIRTPESGSTLRGVGGVQLGTY